MRFSAALALFPLRTDCPGADANHRACVNAGPISRTTKPQMGTGCVKITPADDANDYEVGLRQKLPMINVLNLDGTLNENAGPYQGLAVMEARERSSPIWKNLGLLENVEDRVVELAHSDRSKTPIEPLLTDQWFVGHGAAVADGHGRGDRRPGENHSRPLCEGLPGLAGRKRDWPISRQLWWGHQIPIWYCKTAKRGRAARGVCRPRRRGLAARRAVPSSG